ncbi:MAG: hypothetical protein AABX08_04115 [Nanoarchaeota archaeon]
MEEVAYQDPNQIFSEIINRIRSIESKYNLLGERLLVVNQNMITQFKKNTTEFKAINDDIKEIRSELFKIKETIKDLSRELQFFATKEHIKALEKYINIWDPMKFITEQDLDKILAERGLIKKREK